MGTVLLQRKLKDGLYQYSEPLGAAALVSTLDSESMKSSGSVNNDESNKCSPTCLTVCQNNVNIWHRRLGHP